MKPFPSQPLRTTVYGYALVRRRSSAFVQRLHRRDLFIRLGANRQQPLIFLLGALARTQ